MDGHGGEVGVAAREFGGVQDVGELALPVADPLARESVVLRGAERVELDSAARVRFEADGGEGYDPHVGVAGCGCGAEERGEEQFGQ